VTVGFTPTQTGPRSGQLSITDNVSSSPQVIALSGTGTDFALQAAAGSQLSATTASGTTATYNLAVTPLSGFTGMVALSCAGAPAEGSCITSASSVNVDGSAAPVTVSVTTAATTLSYPESRQQHRMGAFAALVLPLGAFAFVSGKRRRRLLSGLFYLVLLLYVEGFVGCGGGDAGANVASSDSGVGNGTAPVTSMLTLSGVSGTQTRTVTLTLTVQWYKPGLSAACWKFSNEGLCASSPNHEHWVNWLSLVGQGSGHRMKSEFWEWKVFAVVCHEGQAMLERRCSYNHIC
jgi:hypothetical protein